MKKVCLENESVKLVDVSRWQGVFDWNGAIARGYVGGIIKSNDVIRGTVSDDREFERNWTTAGKLGAYRSAYAFFHPGFSPAAQADRLAQHVGVLGPKDLPCAIDTEVMDGTHPMQARENLLISLVEVERLTKKTPMVYGPPYFLQALGLDDRFARFPLWIAQYGPSCPLIPDPWDKCAIWQYCGTGLDTNYFNGTAAQLAAWAEASVG